MNASSQRVELKPDVSTEIKLWRNDRAASPAVLLLPALGIPAGAYRRVAEAICAAGCHVLTIDLRGIGSSSVRATRKIDWGYADMINGELEALLHHARVQLPDSTLHWFCHSMGGHLAVIHSIEQLTAGKASADGIMLAASGDPRIDLLAPKVRRQARLLVLIVRAMLPIMGVFRGDWVGFGGRQSATLMREWAGFVVDGTMPMGDKRLPSENAASIRVLGLAMDADDFAPVAAVTALAKRLTAEPQIETIAAENNLPPPGHTAWLKSPPSALINAVAAFVRGDS